MNSLLVLSLFAIWSQGKPMPTPGYGYGCAVVGNLVYAVGGLQQMGDCDAPRSEVEAYKVAADTWVTGYAPMPQPRAWFGCAALAGKIYVIGGFNGNQEFRRVDRFDPATNTWDTVAPLPFARQALGACELGGRLYAIGGVGNYRYHRTVFRYEPDSGLGSWDTVAWMNSYRYSLGVAVVRGRIYAIGGRYFGNDRKTSEYFDPDSNKWFDVRGQMRESRSALAAVGYEQDGHAYVCAIGGLHGTAALSLVELMDISDSVWKPQEALPTARYFLGAATVAGWVVTLGGLNGQGTVGTVEYNWLPVGVFEQQPGQLRPGSSLLPTVVRGRIIGPEHSRRFEVLDRTGSIIRTHAGALDFDLAPGVYFVRTETRDRILTTSKVVVVR